MAQIASVAAITGTGKAFAVNEQGVSRELKAGDVLQKGETIRTVGDVQVELLMEDGRLMAVAPNQVLRLDENVSESDQRPTAQDSAVDASAATADTILQALERGTDLSTELEATAAGLGGAGGADGGSSFVQLLRIVEGVDPLSYNYSFEARDVPPGLQGASEVLSATVTDPDDLFGTDEDTPVVTTANDPPEVSTNSLSVSEDGLTTGNPDTPETPGPNSNFDQDTATTIDPDNTSHTYVLLNPVSVLTSQGQTVTWSGANTQTLTGTALIGGQTVTVLTVTVDNTGKYSASLSGQIDHVNPAGQTNQETSNNFTFEVKATDSGGLSDTSTVTVQIDDDTPILISDASELGSNQTLILANVGDTDTAVDISGTANTGIKVGGDIGGSEVNLSVGSSVTGTSAAFMGSYTLDGGVTTKTIQMTSTNGDTTYNLLFKDEGGSIKVYYLNGTTEVTVMIVAAQIDPNTGLVTQTTSISGVIDKPTIIFTSPDSISGGGKTPQLTYTDSATGYKLIVTADDTTTGASYDADVNYSSQRLGVDVTSNDKAQYIEMGEKLTVKLVTSNNIPVEMSSASFISDQLDSAETANWSAISGATSTPGTVTGVGNGASTDEKFVVTSSTGSFSQVDFTAPSGTNYGILATEIKVALPVDQVTASFNVVATDGDGDSISGSFKVILDYNSTLDGTTGNDVIVGSDAAEILLGGAGNDTLIGGAGDDTLIGGAGDDTLIGGEGNDTIQINLAESTPGGTDVDVVTDLESGDKIVASDLLVGADGDMTALLPEGSTTVALDSNGADEGGAKQSVVVENVSSDELTVGLLMEGTITIKIDTSSEPT